MPAKREKMRGYFFKGLPFIVALMAGFRGVQGFEFEEQETKYALVIGTNSYDDRSSNLSDLRYPDHDAKALAETLRDQGYSVSTLTTTDGKFDPNRAPTASNIRDALAKLCGGKKKTEMVLLALSGHGIQYIVRDPAEKGPSRTFQYYCPQDADGNPLIDYKTGLSDKYLGLHEIVESLNKSGASHKLLFLDACRNEKDAVGKSEDIYEVKPGPGVELFFSCKSGERSYESPLVGESGGGLFFYYLIEALKGAASDNYGDITYELVKHHVTVALRVNAGRLIGNGGVQIPYASTGQGESIPFKKLGKALFPVIKKGTFVLGSPSTETGRQSDEDQVEIRIDYDFAIGSHEVTQAQFREIMGYNPSKFGKASVGRPGVIYPPEALPGSGIGAATGIMETTNYPVENVSWEEAKEYCRKLTIKKAPKGFRYRLPTEKEWEYACRGGADANRNELFGKGSTLPELQANFAGEAKLNSGSRIGPKPVGSYASSFRLYDMHGNVAEWCEDSYQPVRLGNLSQNRFLYHLETKIIKGGNFASPAAHCRVAFRARENKDSRNPLTGFRVVLVPDN